LGNFPTSELYIIFWKNARGMLYKYNITTICHLTNNYFPCYDKSVMKIDSQINLNGVYTYEELEKILGITQRTLSYFVEKGDLKVIKFGNKYRFLGDEVLKFLRSKMEDGSEKPPESRREFA
jgi:excisionase family DNA binding protein